MNIMYTGMLDVEPSAFSLKVEKMVVRHGEMPLDCHGRIRENHWPYSFSGTAMLQPEGHYKFDSADYVDDAKVQTSIYILKPKCSLEDCSIEGFWYEKTKGYEPEIWKFSGTLDTF